MVPAIRGIMLGNPALDLVDTGKGSVPSQLQFRGDQPILGVRGVILPECPIGAVAGGLEIAHQRIANLIPAVGSLFRSFGSGGNGARVRRHWKSASSTASSTRRPPKAMHRGSPLSSRPRQQE